MKEKQEIVENDPVSQLLGSLKRVEAPGDFDFRVKARIAAGRPVDRNKSWLPAVARFAVPLGLLLLIGGFFGYNALYSPKNIAVVPVVEKQPADVAIVMRSKKLRRGRQIKLLQRPSNLKRSLRPTKSPHRDKTKRESFLPNLSKSSRAASRVTRQAGRPV